MEITRKQFILIFLFSFLFGVATWMLNSFEGTKITTTEFANLGALVGVLSGLASLALIGPLIIFPLTWFLNQKGSSIIVKMMILVILNIGLGLVIFNLLFSEFIEEYQLSYLSACYIYAVVGLLYTLIEHKFSN